MFISATKSIVCFLLFFFLLLTAEASCFLRHQLYRMQSFSFMDIQTFLKAGGWELASQNSVAETTSGFGFEKSVFTKSSGEMLAIYSSKSYGNIIQLNVSASCFQTISVNEFKNLTRKLINEQDRVIKEYREGNQIIQLVEYATNKGDGPEILIFNEDLKNQVKSLDQWFGATPSNSRVSTGASHSKSSSGASKGEIYEVVETQPNPPGGMQGWNRYLIENLRYPTGARRMGIEGTVVVVFVVNTDGTISDIEISRGIGGGCDEEAIRIVEGSPKWTPGMQGGKAVRARMRLPLSFLLGEEPSEAVPQTTSRQSD